MCAHAVRVAIQKMPGVDSVNVSLARAMTDVRLEPGNTVTLVKLRQILKDSGFTARDATVTVVGSLIERGGKPALDVRGLGVVWLLSRDPQHAAAYDDAVKRSESGQPEMVEVVGVVKAPSADPERITVQRLTPEVTRSSSREIRPYPPDLWPRASPYPNLDRHISRSEGNGSSAAPRQ